MIKNGHPKWVKISFMFHLLQSWLLLIFFFLGGVGGVVVGGVCGGSGAENLLW